MRIFRSSSGNLASGEPTPATRSQLLPLTRRGNSSPSITCHDNLGKSKTHREGHRYVSSTTGVCRKLVIQSVNPTAPNEEPISDHTGKVNRVAVWLVSTNPFRHRNFVKWIGNWFWFTFKLLWDLIWLIANLYSQLFFGMDVTDFWGGDSELYDTGKYKPYVREFRSQFWAARSKNEYSTRVKGNDEIGDIQRHSHYPRILVVRDPGRNEWSICTDPSIIKRSKYMAISYPTTDVYTPGSNEKRDKELFAQEVRVAAVQKHFDAYWLDFECLGETQEEKNLNLYCMADVYRGAELTLIMLSSSQDDEQVAWERWGERVWTLPEVLLSQRLFCKFRDRNGIQSISLHQLANLAYFNHDLDHAIINSYGGRDPLERLERLLLLKSAIWRRDIRIASAPTATPHSVRGSHAGSIARAAERVYALMSFFEHRIEPDDVENELQALARLFMANDNHCIAGRMVSLLPSTIPENGCWYADDDIYGANIWDVLSEIQVAGVTKHGALVLDGCRAACIRWKDFPEVAFNKSSSIRRTVIGFLPSLAWPIIIAGAVVAAVTQGDTQTGGFAMLAFGILLLLASPRLLVFSEGGRVLEAQPWFIGVKGVLDRDAAAVHLYGVPDKGQNRGGSKEQYDDAKKAEEGPHAGKMYTLIDTYSSTIYYFHADRPPTVCLFTGREGGLGRFVLCSEKCEVNALHKETVLRMPTYVGDRMEMCGWLALG